MQKSLLLEIFSGFSKKEWREFEKWLQSPVHNQREDTLLLYRHVQENWGLDEALQKKKAWKAVFKGEKYKDAQMRQVMYFLTQAAEDYLVFKEMQEEPLLQHLTLASYFRRHQMEKPFHATSNVLRRKLEAQPLRNQTYLDYLYRLERENSDYWSNQRRSESLHLQETAEALDLSFIATKLRLSCAMLSHQSVNRKVQYDEGILPLVLQYIEEKGLQEHPAIAGFYYGYMLSTRQVGTEYFENLTRFMESYHETMSLDELRELYRMALNYCIHQVNTGFLDFASSALDLYKSGFDRGALLDESGKMSRFSFVNTIGMALKVGAYDWAESFIQNYKSRLDDRHRDNMINFNLSRVYFEKKDYEQAQRLLTTYEYDDLLFNLLAKTMLLKIYFEEEEIDALESLIGSMGAYLKRKETLDDNRRIGYKNFLKIMKKIINLSPSARIAKEKLRTLVEDTQPLMEREWLRGVLAG